MNRTRLILVVVLVVVILAAAGAFAAVQLGLIGGGGNGGSDNGGGIAAVSGPPTSTPTPLPPTPTPIPEIDIVVAAQDIPRGVPITPNMIDVIPIAQPYAPRRAFSSENEVVGRIARTDIFRENFILSNQLVDDLGNLASVGSDAAAILPPNRVAVTLPMDVFTSVGYAVAPGDRVDVIVSMLFVDIDPVFQSIEPNEFSLLEITADEDTGVVNLARGFDGRGEFDTRRIPTGGVGNLAGQILTWPVLFSPSEDQRPRLTTQRTVQDAEVVWVGPFPRDGMLFRPAPSPTPIPPTLAPGETETPEPAAPPATATPERPQIVTLAVRPQDAVVLTYLAEAQLPMTFALRSARSQGLPPTDPVTLDYIMTTFNIAVPDRFNYGVQPAITSIRSLTLGDRIQLNE